MYDVYVQKACNCFLKSEYATSTSFTTQREAYQYAHLVAELMNEECCKTHEFYAQPGEGDSFVIKSPLNMTFVSGCSTGISCDVGCGSTDDWTLESTDIKDDAC